MRKAIFWIAAFLEILSACQGRQSPGEREADLVIRNARVYAVDAQRPWAQAVAIEADHIRWVGNEKHVDAYIGPATKVMDAFADAVLGLVMPLTSSTMRAIQS